MTVCANGGACNIPIAMPRTQIREHFSQDQDRHDGSYLVLNLYYDTPHNHHSSVLRASEQEREAKKASPHIHEQLVSQQLPRSFDGKGKYLYE